AGPYAARRALAGPKFQPRPALEGRSTLTSAFAPRPMLAATPEPADPAAMTGRPAMAAAPVPPTPGTYAPPRPPDRTRQGQHPGAGPGATAVQPPGAGPGAAAGQPPAAAGDARSQPDGVTSPDAVFRPPGQLPQTLRRAPVSGSPPWEPAPRPTSELPWTAVQGPLADSGLSFGRSGAGAGSAPSASSAPRPIFDPDPSPEQTLSGPGIRESFQQATDSGGRPIYIWDPGSATDAEQGNTET